MRRQRIWRKRAAVQASEPVWGIAVTRTHRHAGFKNKKAADAVFRGCELRVRLPEVLVVPEVDASLVRDFYCHTKVPEEGFCVRLNLRLRSFAHITGVEVEDVVSLMSAPGERPA